MMHKTDKIMEHILDRDSDIAFLTETWLTSECNHVTAMVKTHGYELLHCRRKNSVKEVGGGVGVLVKAKIKKKQLKSKNVSSFEHTIVKIFLHNNKSITLVCIYRLLFVSVVIILQELTQLLELMIVSHERVIIAGDVNIHTETDGSFSKQFADILDMFNMIQHVKEPTHIKGHTLDIVATFRNDPIVSGVEVNDYDISHHYLIDFMATCSPIVPDFKTIAYRNIKGVDAELFSTDINQRWNEILEGGSFGENMEEYNKIM